MSDDERYAPHNPIPEELVSSLGSDKVFSPGFSIKDKVNTVAVGWRVVEMDGSTTNDNT